MPAFRLLDQNPVYFNNDLTVCAGGQIRIYTNLTTTPTNAGEGQDLTPSLGATITLDSAGRAVDDIWLDNVTTYRIRLYNAAGVMQWSRDYTQSGATAGITPLNPASGTLDQVYSTNGTTALWRTISEVPSQTGNAGKFLKTDGTIATWAAEQTLPTYTAASLPGGITQTNTASGGFTIGNIRVQWGTDTAPISANVLSSKAVTFGVAFSGAPYSVQVTPTVGGVTLDTPAGRCSAQALSASATGFTASVFAGAEANGGGTNISSAVSFNWLAIGPL